MGHSQPLTQVQNDDIVDVVDRALPEVYGYLLHRCGSRTLAEDLTSESVLAAIDRVCNGTLDELTVAYLIGIARHKLVDHWRREERERRHMTAHAGDAGSDEFNDDPFEPGRATAALAALNPMQRAALTLRYVDDLPVPIVASTLGRSVTATETLLIRAKRAFRDDYSRGGSADHD